MATYRFASATSGFIPKATGQVISYIRDPKKFALNRYCQFIETDATVFAYFIVNRDDAIRTMDEALHVWADGADRPVQDWNGMRYKVATAETTRRNYSFRIGNKALAMNKDSWAILQQHTGFVMNQALTYRTNRIITALQTASNWTPTNSTATANDLNDGAGRWATASDEPSSPNYNAISKSMLAAAQRINLATNGHVEPDDLVMVLSPGLARVMSNTAELKNYLKYGPFSEKQLDNSANINARWGLPPNLNGIELIVESTPRVSANYDAAGTAATRTYVKTDTSAIMLSRKGGIDGNFGAPSFSTVQLYWFKDLGTVYAFDDPHHLRTEGHVVDDLAELIPAPESGFYITDV